jgi:hypothetical protein
MEKAFRKDSGEHLRNSIEKKIPSTSKKKQIGWWLSHMICMMWTRKNN